MSFPAAAASAPPVATIDDDAWEDLLNFVEEKRVIWLSTQKTSATKVTVVKL
jgi:hypothetical protein